MRNDAAVVRVAGMVVADPIRGMNMDFDVAFDSPFLGFHDKLGPEEVGSGLEVPVSGIEDGHGFALLGKQGFGSQGGVVPDALNMPFRVGKALSAVVQDPRAQLREPLPVAIGTGNARGI